jgi:hypothetical protein
MAFSDGAGRVAGTVAEMTAKRPRFPGTLRAIAVIHRPVIVAGLIALTLIFSAGAVWLASKASIHADESDREGFKQKVEDVTVRNSIRRMRDESIAAYLRWLSHGVYAVALRAQAGPAPDPDAAKLRLEARAEQKIANAAWISIPREARSGGGGRLTLDNADRIAYLRIERERDLDSGPEFRDADRARTKAERLKLLSALLIVAAISFAVSQILRTRASSLSFQLGFAVLVTATALSIVVQVAT